MNLRTTLATWHQHLLPWFKLARLHHPTDLGVLWLLGLWGLWLGSDGKPALTTLLLLLLALLALRSLAWLAHDIANALLAHPRHRLGEALRTLPLRLRLLGVAELALAAAVLTSLGWQTAAVVASSSVLGLVFLALRRRTYIGELLLALALGGATVAGYTAAGALPGRTAWLVYTAAVLWSGAALTQYAACYLREHNHLGIKSITMLFGETDRWLIALLQGFALTALWLTGQQEKLGVFMTVAAVAAVAVGGYQQYQMHRSESIGYRRAWYSNLWMGLALFCGIAFSYLCRSPAS